MSGSGGGSQGPRLVQQAEYHLYGNVESLGSVRLTHSERDALVLSFREAKVSSFRGWRGSTGISPPQGWFPFLK